MRFLFRAFRWGKCRILIVRFIASIYICLVMFALFNYKSRVRYEMPTTMFFDPIFTSNPESSKCRLNLTALDMVKLDIFERPSMSSVESLYPNVNPGGWWSPASCDAWQKVAIVVPYRDRYEHLILLLKRLHSLLQKQKIHYRIIVIEQSGKEKFNRGRLLNVGVAESLKYDSFDCFVFHDADLLPEHDQNIYYCDNHAHHLASAIDEMRYHLMYYNYLGGVIAVNKENVFRANGHSNDYWGWGNEDDDFNARTEAIGLLLTRPPENIGKYKMVRHTKQWRADNGNGLFMAWRSRWKTDGLNSLASKYKVLSKTDYKLYTNVSVDFGIPPASVSIPKNATTESIFWFLNYYFP